MPTNDLRHMPRRIYPLRVLGMGLGGVVVAMVLRGRDASLAEWLCMALPALVWPHVAYQWAKRSADPYRTEIRSLLIDSAFAGAWVPLMHFGLLPCVLLITLTMVDKITTGIRGLWLRSLPGMVGASLLGAWITGFQVSLESPMLVVIACMPVLMLHTLSVSVVSYKLIRKVTRQNQQLDELRRIDALTGLYGRGHWEEQAEAALRRHIANGEAASLLMIDIDNFKAINDSLGHTVGDEVIRTAAHIIRDCVRSTDCAGRYGGDEFAVILTGLDTRAAQTIAERIRAEVAARRFRGFEHLQVTSSIGVAAADTRHTTLRNWMDAADAALYRAKGSGRNRVAGNTTPSALTQPAALGKG